MSKPMWVVRLKEPKKPPKYMRFVTRREAKEAELDANCNVFGDTKVYKEKRK